MPSPNCRVTAAFDFQSRQPASCIFVIFAKLVNITGVIILAAGERDVNLKDLAKIRQMESVGGRKLQDATEEPNTRSGLLKRMGGAS